MKHQKHAKLTRPNYGFFARNEWAIIGTTCGDIQQLAQRLTAVFSAKCKVAYVDADHKSADDTANAPQNSAFAAGAQLEYTDKIGYHRFDTKEQYDVWQFRQAFNETDFLIVNGNHFKAKKQVVVIDERKKESLSRKLDRLTDVDLILLKNADDTIYDFLQAHLATVNAIPMLLWDDFDGIVSFFEKALAAAKPVLNGLVLAGGKSQRMGHDKGLITYYQKPQQEHVYELIDAFCDTTFLSIRTDQTLDNDLATIKDAFVGLGPFGAILSAFKEYPNHAWLVVACDLPLLNEASISTLLENRNPSKIATAFLNPATGFPDPLVTIWEPKSYPILYQFLAQGYSCPRKVLINSDIELVDLPDPSILKNVNNPEELEEARRAIKKGFSK